MKADASPLVVNGWAVFAHPLFLGQVDSLIRAVEARKRKDPKGYRAANSAKRLAAIFRLVTEQIPADPAHPRFRQGGALGVHRKHWFRAKFFRRYRLFFRFDSRAKVIVLAWVNDTDTLRARGSRADVYAVFKGMLDNGNPPDNFDALLREAKPASRQFAGAGRSNRPAD